MKSVSYKGLGIGASGHWSFRMHKAMEVDGRVRYWSGVGLAPYEKRPTLDLLFRIPRERYYQIKAGDAIPEKAFKGNDWAHIASPNDNHKEQTIQCVNHGLVTVTEKTLAVNPQEYFELCDFLESNGHARLVRPRRHYLEKALTLALTEREPRILDRLIREHGRVAMTYMTFFETKADDFRRKHIFQYKNGGIQTDWSHPLAILSKAMHGEFEECREAELYLTNPALDDTATGYYSVYKMRGKRFDNSSFAVIRAEKGHPSGINHKTVRFTLQDSYQLDLTYVSTEREYEGLRGFWRTSNPENGTKGRIGMPKGNLSNVVLIDEVVRMIQGSEPKFSIRDDRRIFEGVQMFNETLDRKPAHSKSSEVDQFLFDGMTQAPMIEEVKDLVS